MQIRSLVGSAVNKPCKSYKDAVYFLRKLGVDSTLLKQCSALGAAADFRRHGSPSEVLRLTVLIEHFLQARPQLFEKSCFGLEKEMEEVKEEVKEKENISLQQKLLQLAQQHLLQQQLRLPQRPHPPTQAQQHLPHEPPNPLLLGAARANIGDELAPTVKGDNDVKQAIARLDDLKQAWHDGTEVANIPSYDEVLKKMDDVFA